MKKEKWLESEDSLLLKLKNKKLSYIELQEVFPGKTIDSLRNRFYTLQQNNNTKYEREARILVFDIETSLMGFTGWKTGEQYLGDTNIQWDYFIMSWAAKWLGEKEVYSDVLTSKEAKNKDDKRVCKSVWKLLDEADIVITHNGDRFDIKKLNTRFIFNKLGLPRPYKSIDTLKVARKTFAFSSNRLDYLCKFLGMEAKSEHSGLSTWIECLQGNKKELDILVSYNKNDVVILENLYNVLKEGLVNPPKQPKHGYK